MVIPQVRSGTGLLEAWLRWSGLTQHRPSRCSRDKCTSGEKNVRYRPIPPTNIEVQYSTTYKV